MKRLIYVGLCLLLGGSAARSQQQLTIGVQPTTVYKEQGEGGQYLNMDFVVKNGRADSVTLVKLGVSVYDEQGRLVHARFLDDNGTAPSIRTLPVRLLGGGETKLVFNPFTDFSAALPLHRLEYEWTFTTPAGATFTLATVVTPRKYAPKHVMVFPLKGRVLVYDGHDFYSHHRRFDYEFAPIKQLGIAANFMRYAYDFVVLDSAGRYARNNARDDTSYYGFGAAVYAVAPGRVIYASDRHGDDKSFNIPAMAENALELYGNCIAVQHGDSTVSIYGHLKQHSLKVKTGDAVKGGQQLGAVGVSGSSFFPHLHFEVRTSIKGSAEGVPSYFSNLLILENGFKALTSGLPQTGNIVMSRD